MKKRSMYRIFLVVTGVLAIVKSFFVPEGKIFGIFVAAVVFAFLITTAVIMITDPHMFEYERDNPERIARLPKIGWFLAVVTVLMIVGYIFVVVKFS